MKFKIKSRGLIFDKKKAFKANSNKFLVSKSFNSSDDSILVYFKGKKDSGILELTREEIDNISKLIHQ